MRLPLLKNQRRNIIWHFCRINAGRAPAVGTESSLQMCPEATRLNSLFMQRAISERSKLSVCRNLFPQAVRQAVKVCQTALCAGVKEREAGRSQKASCAPMHFNSPRPRSKNCIFATSDRDKKQRASPFSIYFARCSPY